MKTILHTVLLLAAVSITLSTQTVAQPATPQAKPGSALAQGNPTPQSLITVADVEKVSGLTGIKQVLQSDNVNFTTQDNKMVLKVQVHSHFGDRLYKQTRLRVLTSMPV